MSKNDDSSSSSDDENLTNAFREACDENFLPQSLFDTKNSSIPESDTKVEVEIKPSLRVTERADNFESFGVSQSFKNYVAKKLDALLDRSILDDSCNDLEEDSPKKKKKKKRRTKNECGIKLLSSSSEPITEIEQVQSETQKRIIKPWKFTAESEARNMRKCQEVAVDGNWVLSKAETKAWKERCKGAVFKYKKSRNGVLVEDQ
ncbi:uncharacterized protein [Venturia canescens]|uniref:uncharacterized protein n=1 Tax=Venturia canescens TaxID=32260 RepID=UPI001C9BE714|nr:uncharacterized protein LOC122408711 [Venturia canescens]